MLRSYIEGSGLGTIKALSVGGITNQPLYNKCSAPVELSYFPSYAAYLYLVWDDLFPSYDQLAIDDLFSESRYLAILGWDRSTATRWLDWMADEGLLHLDRQTGGTIALKLQYTEAVVNKIYDQLI